MDQARQCLSRGAAGRRLSCTKRSAAGTAAERCASAHGERTRLPALSRLEAGATHGTLRRFANGSTSQPC